MRREGRRLPGGVGSDLWLVALLLCALPVPLLASPAAGTVRERAHIYYPRGACDSPQLQLQVWNPQRGAWRPHPEHPRVPVDSCQTEDPGILLNAIRWRCDEPHLGRRDGWYVGVDIFDPAIISSCQVGALEADAPDIEIHVASPRPGAVLQDERSLAVLEGSVRVDGIEGSEYDVVIAIDRSAGGEHAERRLRAQVAAARAWLRALAGRLGALRVGIVSYPELREGAAPSARVHAALSGDAGVLARALDAVENAGVAGAPAFLAGVTTALDLLAPRGEARARPRARPHLLLGIDGDAAPISDSARRPDFAVRARELAQRAQRNGVRVHLYALAGLAQEPAATARDFVEHSMGRLERVPIDALATPFFATAALPVPERLAVLNPRTQAVTLATLDAAGRFRAEVPVLAGENSLELVATTSDARSRAVDWRVSFDDRLARARLLAAERERMQRLRAEKHLELEVEARASSATTNAHAPPSNSAPEP